MSSEMLMFERVGTSPAFSGGGAGSADAGGGAGACGTGFGSEPHAASKINEPRGINRVRMVHFLARIWGGPYSLGLYSLVPGPLRSAMGADGTESLICRPSIPAEGGGAFQFTAARGSSAPAWSRIG